MRAVAVLAVFADHLFGWPSGGFVGVDVFFVLSGFFITGLLIRERTTTHQLSFQNFYTRRAKRILPSALLVLVVSVVGGYFLLPGSRAKETLIDALYAALFAANFRFEAAGADYFQQDQPPSPLQHYWSLSIEEQFYFVWPVLLMAIFAITRSSRGRTDVQVRQWSLFIVMSLVVAASFAWAMIESSSDPNSAYFSTPTRVWELGVGALVAIAGPWLARIPDRPRPALAYVGLAGVATSLFVIDAEVQFPAPWAALPVLSTALVIASFHGAEVRRMHFLTNRVARWFGDTSYTLYLWHWPVIVLLANVFPEGPHYYFLVIALALGFTATTYHFFEDPIRKSEWLVEQTNRNKLVVRPSGWALIGGALAAAAFITILYIEYVEKLSAAKAQASSAVVIDLPLPPETDSLSAEGTDAPPIAVLPGNDPCFGAPAMVNGACSLRNPDKPLRPSIEEFATETGGASCWTGLGEQLRSCTYGYGGPDATRIALVGDSHAGRILQGLIPYLEGNKWHLTAYVGQGCVWMSPPKDTCPAMSEIEKQLLSERYDLVLTTSRRTGSAANYAPAWKPVLLAGSRVTVIADNPMASEQALACLTRVDFGGDGTADCENPRARATPQDPQAAAASRMTLPVDVIDLTAYYCSKTTCPLVIGDAIVYADTSSHVTPTFMRTIAPALVNGIRDTLG